VKAIANRQRSNVAQEVPMPDQNEPSQADTIDNLSSLEANLESRRAKLERIRGRGIDPYPPRFQRDSTAAEAVTRFEAAEAAD